MSKTSNTWRWVPLKRFWGIAIVAFATTLSSRTASADGPGNWSRILTDADAFTRMPAVPFVISYIRYESGLMSVPMAGTCWYRYTVGTDPVIIHGKKRPDGAFAPSVVYEIAVEGKTKWRKIHAEEVSPDNESLAVSPENPVVELWVDMQPFQKYLGVSRYGRLVLENGDAAVFEIEDLLPTVDAQGDSHNYKASPLQTDDDKRQEGFAESWLEEPGTLLTTVSLGDRLTGEFLFEAPPTKSVSLEGTRTLDGDFWPQVGFQVTNSGEEWKTIGKSRPNGVATVLQIPMGNAERMRVLLTDFKPVIGKYKFGRIVFSNGQAGVFSINHLNSRK
jgi:hypothetical protein